MINGGHGYHLHCIIRISLAALLHKALDGGRRLSISKKPVNSNEVTMISYIVREIASLKAQAVHWVVAQYT